MLKKVFGYIFILLGFLFILSIIGNLIILIKGERHGTEDDVVSTVGAIIFAGVLIFLFFKFGFDWIKKKPKIEIDDIGKE